MCGRADTDHPGLERVSTRPSAGLGSPGTAAEPLWSIFPSHGGRQTEHKASTGESQIENIKRLLMHDPTHHVAQTQLESPISAGSAFPFGLRYFESLYLHPRVLVRVVSKEKQFQVASALHTQYQSRQNYVFTRFLSVRDGYFQVCKNPWNTVSMAFFLT